jgi:hypothetical protein
MVWGPNVRDTDAWARMRIPFVMSDGKTHVRVRGPPVGDINTSPSKNSLIKMPVALARALDSAMFALLGLHQDLSPTVFFFPTSTNFTYARQRDADRARGQRNGTGKR